MISISTASISGVFLQDLNRIAAGFRRQDMHIIAFQHARQSENIANVIIHDEHSLAIQHGIVFVQLFQHLALSFFELGDGPMQQQADLVEQSLGRLHMPNRRERDKPVGHRIVEQQRLLGIHHERRSRSRAMVADLVDQAIDRKIGPLTIEHDAIEAAFLEQSQRFLAFASAAVERTSPLPIRA